MKSAKGSKPACFPSQETQRRVVRKDHVIAYVNCKVNTGSVAADITTITICTLLLTMEVSNNNN